MQIIYDTFTCIINSIKNLKIEQITLISILVTLIIFVMGRKSDVKFKKLESRRDEYKKFINMLQKVYTGKLKQDDKTKNEFFDTGVSLLIYGSKKIYKKYMFFREYSSNPLIKNSKHKKDMVSIYIIADILKTIRHEVGMSNFGELESNEILSFFVNDIGMNPLSKIQSYQVTNDIFMLKIELFMFDRYKFVFIKKVYYCIIKPLWEIVFILLKYIILIPFGKFLKFIFPQWAKKIEEENSK